MQFFRPELDLNYEHMFATRINRAKDALLDGVDLAVEFATLGEYNQPSACKESPNGSCAGPSDSSIIRPSSRKRNWGCVDIAPKVRP